VLDRPEAAALAAEAAAAGGRLTPLALEVTDEASCAAAVAAVEAAAGPVDVLVNNAGVGSSGAVEDTPVSTMRALLETNLLGPARLCRLVLPSMRGRRAGAIVNMSSAAGRTAHACHGGYAASKWALEALSECLAMEVARFGIRVAVIEPGCIVTPIWKQYDPATAVWTPTARDASKPYAELQLRFDRYFKKMFAERPMPTLVAEAVAAALAAAEPKLRWPVGTDAVRMTAGRARMPDAAMVGYGLPLTEPELQRWWREWYGFEDFADDRDQLHTLLAARPPPPAFDPGALRLRPASVVLVTGSSTGIGCAVCLDLARRGHRVFASMRGPVGRPEARALLAAAAEEDLAVELVTLDVSDEASRGAAVAAVLAVAGRVDVLVNNAGLGGDAKAVEEAADASWREHLEANFLGAVHMAQLVLPGMRDRGSGTIVNVTSTHGRWTAGCHAVYCASKYALEAISEQLAQEVIRFGVRVVVLLPGVIITPIFGMGAPPPRTSSAEAEAAAAYAPVLEARDRFYEYGLAIGQGPDVVAEVLHGALTDGTLRLRYVAGADVEPLVGRHGTGPRQLTVTDEQHVALGLEMSEADFVGYWQRHYGIDLSATRPGGLVRLVGRLARSEQGLDGPRAAL
jgi:NAD(P)-dependent dehydrogenase (short-subunit alcohol dehydrogenase family)